MSGKMQISRRTMLRGLGVGISLPLLDAMLPSGGLMSAAEAAGATASAASHPVRIAAIFLPNGMMIDDWRPTDVGSNWQLSKTLEPFAKVKDQMTVLSGLTLDAARAHGDGAGDHARSAAAFLTGAHPYKTAGKDIHLGISMDQLAARKIGNKTRLPSLELGLDKTQTAGNCDSGYSCAYVSNISWRNADSPVPKEVDPGAVFDRLFGSQDDLAAKEHLAKRLKYRKSILDFVSDDTRRLNQQLGSSDRHKLDEFTSSIREIEGRIETARANALAHGNNAPKPDMARPEGIPADFSEHMKLMADMLVLAFRMDLTRVSTLMVARDGSDRLYREIGATEGHHTLSHHGTDQNKMAQLRKIDKYNMQQIAYLLEKLHSTPEGNGTLLDNCLVATGCGIGDGNRHNHDDLPIFIAGRAGGLVKPGRHVKYSRGTPLCNLYMSMLDAVGAPVDRFGDSTGRLSQLNG